MNNLKECENKIVFFKQIMIYYKLNLYLAEFPWIGSKACKKSALKSPQWLRNIKDRKYPFYRLDTFFSNTKFIDVKIISNGAIAGIIGIVLAHIIADFIAAMADPDLQSAAFGIVIGGFLPLLAVPFLEKYVTKSRYHTVVGDHEDLKKDLKKKHR